MSSEVKPSLSLVDQIKEINDLMYKFDNLIESGQEIPPELEVELSNMLIANAQKVDRMASYLRHCESTIEYLKNEKKTIDKLIKAQESKIARIEKAALFAMNLKTTNVLEGALGNKLRIRESTSLEVTDLSKVDGKYIVTKTIVESSADKVAIKKALESGELIEGVELKHKQHLNWTK